MQILSNTSLKAYNSFGIDVSAKLFCETNSVEQIKELMQTTEFKTSWNVHYETFSYAFGF